MGTEKRQKTGGRKVGTPNKKTFFLKDFFDDSGFCIPSTILKKLPLLEPEAQVQVCLKLLAYIYPKPVAANVEDRGDSHSEVMELIRLRQEVELKKLG